MNDVFDEIVNLWIWSAGPILNRTYFSHGNAHMHDRIIILIIKCSQEAEKSEFDHPQIPQNLY